MAEQPKGIRSGDAIITEITFTPPTGSTQSGDSVVRAFADIVILGQFVAKGFKILEGKDGLWVGMPAEKDRKSGAYHDRLFPITTDGREHLTGVMLKIFEKSPLSKPQAAAGAAQSGSGGGIRAWLIEKLGGKPPAAAPSPQQTLGSWGPPASTTSPGGGWGAAPSSAPAPAAGTWGSAPTASPMPAPDTSAYAWGAPPPPSNAPSWTAPGPAPSVAPPQQPAWGTTPPASPSAPPTWGAPGFAGTLGAPSAGVGGKMSAFRQRNPKAFFVIVALGASALVAVGMMFTQGGGSSTGGGKKKPGARPSDSREKSMPAAASKPAPEGVIPWQEAGDYEGQKITVEGEIVRVFNHQDRVIFLNFSRDRDQLSLVIPKKFFDQFPKDVQSAYQNKKVRVTGKVKIYRSAPEISLFGQDQIEVIQ